MVAEICEETPWAMRASVKARGVIVERPIVDKCEKCFNAKQCFPKLTWEEYCRTQREDPTFKAEVDGVKKAQADAEMNGPKELSRETVDRTDAVQSTLKRTWKSIAAKPSRNSLTQPMRRQKSNMRSHTTKSHIFRIVSRPCF